MKSFRLKARLAKCLLQPAGAASWIFLAALGVVCLPVAASSGEPPVSQNDRPEPWRRIILSNPDDPVEVRSYLRRLNAVNVEGPIWSGHPMVGKYAEVGPENMGPLLAYLGSEFPHNHFAIWAVRQIANRSHRDLLIRAVADHESVLPLILQFGWQRDIRDLTVRKLRQAEIRGSQPINRLWLEAGAALNDPSIHPLLINVFRNSPYPETFFSALRPLPANVLQPAVRDVWNDLARQPGERHQQFALIAAEWGQREALDLLISMLRQPPAALPSLAGAPPGEEARARHLREEVIRLTNAPAGSSTQELLHWLEINLPELYYDVSRRSWLTREPIIPRVWTDRDGRTIQAELVNVRGSTVTVRRDDGRVLQFEMERLSLTDQEYVRRQTR